MARRPPVLIGPVPHVGQGRVVPRIVSHQHLVPDEVGVLVRGHRRPLEGAAVSS